jgi:BlaI family transcriptional regulator, penicillinase repressor
MDRPPSLSAPSFPHSAFDEYMPRRTTTHPTDGELEILDVLWREGPLSLGDVCTALRQKRDVATTTVATMLRVMHEKKLVRRRKSKRGYEWSAAVTPDEAARGMIGKLVERVFDGSALRLAAHLVEAGQLSDADLKNLRRLIEQHQSR